ncbi:MAG: TraR/DksA C4-type zinc finger protein [Rhodothermales bacterium]|nr:TraR/DksA C4-type zinc finger protein [Rhodothermales bacterium]MBO6781230.1 TraR/DksA C4-type zinc finger protein [Rhodothermales bacterium]
MDPDRFRQALEGLRFALLARLGGEVAADSSIVPDDAIGRLTRMEALQAQQIGQAGRRRLEGRLKNVEKALKALDDGTYGTCVVCGGEILAGRLEIMPEARSCVKCAARR